jgi:DNA primase
MEVDELLSKKKLYYKNSGQDYLIRCLNPEHEDRNPSLRVNRISGIMNCFSCGFKGNIFKFFDEEVNQRDLQRKRLQDKILSIRADNVGLKMPANYTPFVGTYRGISASTLKKFKAFTSVEPEYAGRVVFPIYDITGKTRAFIGRATDNTIVPKYRIHPAGVKLPLFPGDFELIQGSVILVEGIFDCINLIDKGLDNVICIFGTNNIDTYKMSLLKVIGVTTVYTMFDGDEAGDRAGERVQELGDKIGLLVKKIPIGKDTDPGDLSRERVLKLKEYLYDN